MKIVHMLAVIAICVLVQLSDSAAVFAASDDNSQTKPVDEHGMAMMGQHKAMADMQKNFLAAKSAIDSQNPAEAKKAAVGMQIASKKLGSFMLHKNPDKRGAFNRKGAKFIRLLKTLSKAAHESDMKKFAAILPKVDSACADCHRVFR